MSIDVNALQELSPTDPIPLYARQYAGCCTTPWVDLCGTWVTCWACSVTAA
jgi:hypothetical protein